MTLPSSRGFIAYLVATAVICGALVMVIEVLGSRVIGPFFGVSLFVWTSLITVTLVALAAGYAAGGWLADRRSSPDYLYGIITAAGFAVLFVPLLKAVVLKASVPLGLRLGTLVSALLLFGPALFLLGCVSPYVVKIATRELRNLGRTVGGFYAVSTVGSFVGTLATGFFLIGHVGVNRTFMMTGLILVALGAGYFALFRGKWPVLALLALPFLAQAPEGPVSKVRADGTRVSLVYSRDSFYGNIKVVDYEYGALRTREMLIDGLVQGGVDANTGLSVYEYAYLMQFIPYAMHPTGKSCLAIGLGAGTVVRWFEERGVATEVVDIDPEVVRVSRDYFGYRGSVHIEDARYFLAKSERKYDFLVMDVFNGDTTPGHLVSLEAVRLVRERLTPGGVFAFNLHGSLEADRAMTHSVIKTVRQVFSQVEVYPVYEPKPGEPYGNLVVIAYNGPKRSFDPAMAARFPVHPLAAKLVHASLTGPVPLGEDSRAIVLTDDFNPIDLRDLWLKEKVRRNILETTDWDVLLG